MIPSRRRFYILTRFSRERHLIATLLFALSSPATATQAPSGVRLEIFVREGCPHCHHALEWLRALAASRPEIDLIVLDVGQDAAARERLRDLAASRRIRAPGVPAILVGGQLLIGWQDAGTTGAAILGLLPTGGAPPASARGPPDVVAVPLGGTLSASRLGLPLFTVALGLLDGFNPCAMWALLLILALLVGLGDRRRMLLIGGTFVAVGGVLYFAFMAAWLEVFLIMGFSRALQAVLGGVALTIGLVNVKDFIALGHGPSLAIPARARPGLYARMRRIITAEHLGGALVAVAVLSLIVNLVEFACTAGLPAVYTQVLSSRELSRPVYYGYLALYNLAYVFDDLVLLTIATITLSRPALQERAGRWLKLLSGSVMLVLGALLLWRPSLLM